MTPGQPDLLGPGRETLNKALRQAQAIAPILTALAVAVLATWAWLSGARLFGLALPIPNNVEDWVKVLSFTVGIPTGVLALFTYVSGVQEQQRASLWKRREYLAARFDRLESLRDCKAAMRMLDYHVTDVDLGGPVPERVNDQLVMSALAPHQLRGSYTRQEQAIRDAFDTFFSEMDRLAAMEIAGLMEDADLAPYAGYWLDLFDAARRGRPEAYGAILRRYVRVFHFNSLRKWLERRGLMTGDAETDDALIAAFDPSWIAPAKPLWEELVQKPEASS